MESIGLILIFWYGILHAFGADHLTAIADFSIGKNKRKTNNAYKIMNNIYNKNRDKTDNEIQSMIFDALRETRFNDGRGYFFIYTTNGTNMMHPILPELEGKNLWDFKDKKGLYVLREIKKIIDEDEEGFSYLVVG